MKTYLSKSKVLSGRQCVKRLFLEVHKPQLATQAKVTDRLLSRGLEKKFPHFYLQKTLTS